MTPSKINKSAKPILKKPELLLPAGSLDRLKTAFLYGADAVYAGMPGVSLRNKTSFTMIDMKQGIDYAHAIGKKVYLTINLFTHNRDLERLAEFVGHLKELNPDAVIVADPGVFDYIKEHVPGLPLHISTQANVCSTLTVNYWKKQGADLVVLGREVPLGEIKQIRTECPDIKLETFVHGALCVSYSGRCLLSNFMTGRSANKGNCAHSCRWKYKTYVQTTKTSFNNQMEEGTELEDRKRTLEVRADKGHVPTVQLAVENVFIEEEKRPGELMQIDEDEHGTYIMNSRDLCWLPRLNDILPIGIDSFKIEGRNKSEYYAAITARTYRAAIDDWFKNPEKWDAQKYMNEILTLQSRGYTVGFLDGNAGPEAQNYDVSASSGNWRYAGLVRGTKNGRVVLEVKHKIIPGMVLEFLAPGRFEPIRIEVADFYDAESEARIDTVSSGHLGQSILIPIDKKHLGLLPHLTVVRTKI